MNLDKFYQLAEKNDISKSQLIYKKTDRLSISIFRGEIENYSSASSSNLIARGLYKGKSGSGSTENITSNPFKTLVEEIKTTASLLETKEDPIFFEDEVKYTKKNVFSKELQNWDIKDIIAKLFKLEEVLKKVDKRVQDVQISFQKETEEETFTTSKGLKLTKKLNCFFVGVHLIIEQDGVVKNGFEYILSNNPNDWDLQVMADCVLEKTLAKLGEQPIKDGKYKAVLSPSVVGDFLDVVLMALSSEEIQKHTSFLEGKLNKQVFSKKLTVKELPLTENVFFSYFDAEGVPTQNKTLIDEGVIRTYLYNLVTAKKDGVSSTGNGSRSGSKIKIQYNNVFVEPGKLNLDGLFDELKDGIYITEVSGLHAGLNKENGDFSLESEGFLIKNGKLSTSLPLFTISGNVFEIFNNVVEVGCDNKLLLDKITSPSIIVKEIKISVS